MIWRLCGAGPSDGVHVLSGSTLGTTWSARLSAPHLDGRGRAAVTEAIEATLERVEATVSLRRDDSEVSRFDAFASTDPFAASPEAVAVLLLAREVSRASDGAFDVTAAPLRALWGLDTPDRAPAAPPPAALAAARQRVGFEKIDIDPRSGTLRKSRPDVECDLSQLAQGYAADRVDETLVDLGQRDFVVHVGGAVRARGRRPDGGLWRAALVPTSPEAAAGAVVIPLAGAALARSRDDPEPWESGGIRYGHRIDPRSGRPVAWEVISVGVLHETAARAAAWAAALAVLGPRDGYALAEQRSLAASFRLPDDDAPDGVRRLDTRAFRARVAQATDVDAELRETR